MLSFGLNPASLKTLHRYTPTTLNPKLRYLPSLPLPVGLNVEILRGQGGRLLDSDLCHKILQGPLLLGSLCLESLLSSFLRGSKPVRQLLLQRGVQVREPRLRIRSITRRTWRWRTRLARRRRQLRCLPCPVCQRIGLFRVSEASHSEAARVCLRG